MKPVLILGLGNPLMGDDGIGWKAAERLAHDPRLPPDAEALCAGTDLLRWADQMEGRTRVILIDAILGESAPGTVATFAELSPELEHRQWNVHHLSAPQAIRLLKTALPAMRDVHFTWLAVAIESAEARPELSPTLNARLPEILDIVLRSLSQCQLTH